MCDVTEADKLRLVQLKEVITRGNTVLHRTNLELSNPNQAYRVP